MAKTKKLERQRYSPEVRRSMILDEAASIVAADGVAALSVENICKQAGISKSLIYTYFENLTELQKELLERELKRLRRKQFEAAEAASSFEELVRGVTHQYLTYINERGLIIERLQAEPKLSNLHDPTEYDRASAVDYMTTIVSANFGLPTDLARAVTDISFGLPAAAGEYLLRSGMPLEAVEDITVTMIIGSISKFQERHSTQKALPK